ncbi:MAG: hypothetical protein ABSF84_02885 [Acidimicrobiales bacterium]|jgi:hypothetical protein
MPRPRNIPVVAAVLVLSTVVLAGCSNSGTGSTTTTGSSTRTTVAGSTTSTAPGLANLPATGSVDGLTLSVTSSPRTGTVGQTTIKVTAVLRGLVKSAHLDFQVSDAPSATQGKPATNQVVTVSGPGTYSMPKSYSPTVAGNWAATVTYTPSSPKDSKLSVSGMPPVAGSSAPFPQLVTVVSAG